MTHLRNLGLAAAILAGAIPAWSQAVDAKAAPGGGLPSPSLPADNTDPGMTYDLEVSTSGTTAMLTWTGAGDDGMSGTPWMGYWIIISDLPSIDDDEDPEVIDSGLDPKPAGAALEAEIGGFTAGSSHTFAIVTIDDFGNTSELSNQVTVTFAAPAGPPAPAPAAQAPADAGSTSSNRCGNSASGACPAIALLLAATALVRRIA